MSNQNLFAALRAAFPADLDRIAVETADAGSPTLRYSWRDLDRATAMMANLIDSLALPPASRIAVQTEKSVEALVLYLAVPKQRLGEAFLLHSRIAQGIGAEPALSGQSLGRREVAVMAEQLGRNVNGGGYFGSAVLGVGLLNQLTAGAVRDTLLTGIAAGTTTVTVAISSEAEAHPGFVVAETADGPRITGRAPLVLDAGSADTLLAPVRLPDGRSAVAAVGCRTVGLAVKTRPVVDETRSLADVSADSVLLAADALLDYADGADEPDALPARARAAVACDSLGLSAAMLDATVDYVAVRQQFGRPIGSFQALKHRMADMYVKVQTAAAVVDEALQDPSPTSAATCPAPASQRAPTSSPSLTMAPRRRCPPLPALMAPA